MINTSTFGRLKNICVFLKRMVSDCLTGEYTPTASMGFMCLGRGMENDHAQREIVASRVSKVLPLVQVRSRTLSYLIPDLALARWVEPAGCLNGTRQRELVPGRCRLAKRGSAGSSYILPVSRQCEFGGAELNRLDIRMQWAHHRFQDQSDKRSVHCALTWEVPAKKRVTNHEYPIL